MKINTEPKLDFDDVLLVPHRTKTASRSSIDLERNFTFYHSDSEWSGIPVIAANMDTTGTFCMSESLRKFHLPTCIHKHYQDKKYITDLVDLDYQWFSMGI